MKRYFQRFLSCSIAILLLFFFLTQLNGVMSQAGFNIKILISARGDYNALRKISPTYRAALEAKTIIPSDANVQIIYPKNISEFNKITVNYILYPFESKADGAFLIDWGHSIKNPPPSWSAYRLANGVSVFAKPGAKFNLSKPAPAYPLEKNLFIFFLLTTVNALAGYLILTLFKINAHQEDLLWFLGTCYLIGFIGLSLITWISLMLRCPLEKSTVLGLWGLAIGIFWYLNKMSSKVKVKEKYLTENPKPSFPKNFSLIKSLINLASLVIILIFCLRIIAIPITVWDEMLIWIAKAKYFYYHKHLYFPAQSSSNNYYPILWPVNIASQFVFLGGAYDEVAKWTSAAVFVSFLTQIRGALRRLNLNIFSVGGILTLYLLAFPHWILFTGLPENLFLACLVASINALLGWLKNPDRKNLLLLGAFFGLALSLIKFEGGVTATLCGIALLISTRGSKLSNKDYVTLGIFFLAAVIPLAWMTWLKVHGVDVDVYHLQRGLFLANLEILWKVFVNFLSNSGSITLILLTLATLLNWRNPMPLNRQEEFLAILVGALILFAIFAGLGWPQKDIELYYPEVISRLLLRATPVLLLFWTSRIFNVRFPNRF